MRQAVAVIYVGLPVLTLDVYGVLDSVPGRFRELLMERRPNTTTVAVASHAALRCLSITDSIGALTEKPSERRIGPTTREHARHVLPIKLVGAKRTAKSATQATVYNELSKQESSRVQIAARDVPLAVR
jgi:hypothetical protein